MPATPVPSLSQIRVWDTEHLTTAATHWTSTAQVWDDVFTTVAREIGIPWKGEAAEAAMHRAAMDRVKVVGLADDLHAAAGVARRGADRLDYAKQAVLSAVSQAHEDGFVVGEDLSVSDSTPSRSAAAAAARKSQAQAQRRPDPH